MAMGWRPNRALRDCALQIAPMKPEMDSPSQTASLELDPRDCRTRMKPRKLKMNPLSQFAPLELSPLELDPRDCGTRMVQMVSPELDARDDDTRIALTKPEIIPPVAPRKPEMNPPSRIASLKLGVPFE